MQIASWNVNSLNVRLPQVITWLKTNPVTVLCLQETKMTDDKFPQEALKAAGYSVAFTGQKRYNGVATLSLDPPSDVITALPEMTNDPQRRFLAVTVKDVHVVNIYVPNGASLESDKFIYKMQWLDALRRYLRKALATFDKVIVVGDFNIAPTDLDVHDPEVWQDRLLVSPQEREAFQGLLDLGLNDCFRLLHPEKRWFSWWDYRRGGFPRNHGLRIDHMLATPTITEKITHCTIDREPRTWERPSDHTPVTVTWSSA
ncbi:exodeoxyribonuclease III [Magnetococcales bacterium HHB-1]